MTAALKPRNNMRTLFVLLIVFHVAVAVKHSLTYFLTASYGVQEFPDFLGVAMLDGVQIGYCDSKINKAEPKNNWIKEYMKDNPEHLKMYSTSCQGRQYSFRADIDFMMDRFNQSGGVHILQRMSGCEWDEETGEIVGFNQYGYDGEDFLAIDMKTMTWVAPNPKAFITKLRWDTDKGRLQSNKDFFKHKCSKWLKGYIQQGSISLQKRVLPSVSLLQKSPSSPVCCFATGFYPDRAVMFWRKDGEELHEGVDHGEILPNHDDTYQMSADLDVSSEKPGDWRKYECVFQLYGVMEDIVTRLDQSVISSNNVPGSPPWVPVVTGVVAILLLLSLCFTGFITWRKKKNGFQAVQRK